MGESNNKSNNNSVSKSNYVYILLNIIPVILIVIFTLLFKHLNNYSYCNLKGKLCDEPEINMADNSIINISCKVSDSKGRTEANTSIHLIRFTYVGFGLLLLLIILGSFNILADVADENTINIIILINIIIISLVIYVLVSNKDDINSGHIGYGLSKGFINIIWIINILYTIIFMIFIIYIIMIGQINFLLSKDSISIGIIIVTLLLQVIIYAVFRNKCTKPLYKCIPNITQINPTLNNTQLTTTKINGNLFTQITPDKLQSEYKIACITSGVNSMNIKTIHIVFAIITLIVLLVTIFDFIAYIEHIKNPLMYTIIYIITLISLVIIIILSLI